MKTKEFDAVELQHEGGFRVMEELNGMTKEERLEYWRKCTEELRLRQEKMREEEKAHK